MKKITKFLFATALALAVIPASIFAFSSHNQSVEVRATSGSGTELNPYVVTTFTELKSVLEAEDNCYVVVNEFHGNTGDGAYHTLIANEDYTYEKTTLGQFYYGGAINIPINYEKHLTINTTIDVRAMNKNVLLYSFINNLGKLYINGTGTLKVEFNATGYPNGIILNKSYLQVDGTVTIDATQRFLGGFGYAVFNYLGGCEFNSGTFIGDNKYNDYNIGGVYIYKDITDYSVVFNGGTFSATNSHNANKGYGIMIASGDVVTIKDGTFHGIYVDSKDANGFVLNDFLAKNCSYEHNGYPFDGSSISTTNNTLVVNNPDKNITRVDLTLTTPVVGGPIEAPKLSKDNVVLTGYEWTPGNYSFFEEGTFKLSYRIIPADGCYFGDELTSYVNDVKATLFNGGTGYEYAIFYITYYVEKPAAEKILNAEISVGIPSAGEAPGEPTISPSSHYYLDTYAWQNVDETFIGGNDAKLLVLLKPNDGYEFSYSTSVNINGKVAQIQTFTSQYIIAYYVFSVDVAKFSVSFDVNGGTGSIPSDVDQLGGYILPYDDNIDAPTGYHFLCWAENNPLGKQYLGGEEYDVQSNVTFYAIWEVNAFTKQPMNLAAYTDEEITPEWAVNFGAIKYEVLRKEADIFVLDFTIQNSAHTWFDVTKDVETSVTYKVRAYYDDTHYVESSEFTLSWTDDIVLVAYYGYGDESSGTGDAFYVKRNTSIALDAVEVSGIRPNLGYKFDHWQIGNPSVANKQPGETYIITGETYIFARCTEKTIDSLTANYYGGEIIVGNKLSISSLRMKICYTDESYDEIDTNQAGFYIGSQSININEYVFNVPGEVTIKVMSQEQEATFKVVIKGYSVLLNANGGTGDDVILADKHGTYQLPENPYTAPEGKQFKGWAVGSLNAELKQPGTQINITEDVVVYAVYEVIPATPESLKVTYGNIYATRGDKLDLAKLSIQLTMSDKTKQDVNTSDVTYWNGDSQINDPQNYVFSQVGDAIITVKYQGLEASFKVSVMAKTYKVSFDAGEGSGSMFPITAEEGEYVLPSPEESLIAPSGKVFDSWQVNGEKKLPNQTIEITENITITALWKDAPVETYTVHFAANGGSGSMADVPGQSGDYALPQCEFTAPEGKEFDCWIVSGQEKNPGDTIQITEDITITAKWKDATQVNPDPVDPEPVDPTPADPDPVTPTPSDGGETTPEQPAKKKGCGGSVIAASALISIVSLAGVALLFTKRKQD